ncbi:hypothetical protein [Sediminibacterium roseum]|nr:hypothetical protein [Sediminibacterium roseum]
MKKVWGIARDMIRVVCVCIVFPGIDIDIDNIPRYFGKEDE